MNRAVISIGSNINSGYYVPNGLRRIGRQHNLIKTSSCIQTKPIGFADQDDFTNMVCLIETEMEREDLAHWLKSVEDDLGRVRTSNKFGPRTIDLDIVVWNGEITDADVYERDFLKTLIAEVEPGIVIQ